MQAPCSSIFLLQCFDGVKRLGLIRGKLRKKIWINNGDIILVSLREYQDEKGDVILKYSADEARSLYVSSSNNHSDP